MSIDKLCTENSPLNRTEAEAKAIQISTDMLRTLPKNEIRAVPVIVELLVAHDITGQRVIEFLGIISYCVELSERARKETHDDKQI